MYAFLSSQWVDAVRTIRDEYAAVIDAQAQHTGPDVAINLLITEVPGQPDDVRAHAAVRGDGTALDLGFADDAKILVTMDYATARHAVVDQDIKAIVRGFLLGKIIVKGDLAALLGGDGGPAPDPAALLAAFDLSGASSIGDLDPTAGEIAERIRAVTL